MEKEETNNNEKGQPKERGAESRNIVVHFFRHGEVTSYSPGAGLTEKGVEQSFQAGKGLVGSIDKGGIVKFVTSPSQRATESNEAMIAGLKKAIEEENRGDIKLYTPRKEAKLRPFDVQDSTAIAEVSKQEKDVIGYWLSGQVPEEVVESPGSVFDRIQKYIKRKQKIIERFPSGPTIHYICVTHSQVMRSLVKDTFGDDPKDLKQGAPVEIAFNPNAPPSINYRDQVKEIVN